jgi:hypothetical protein
MMTAVTNHSLAKEIKTGPNKTNLHIQVHYFDYHDKTQTLLQKD